MNHPNAERFLSDYIPFPKYSIDEVTYDYEDDNSIDILYKNFTPRNWGQKQLGIDTNIPSEFVDAFKPGYDEKACQKLIDTKKLFCGVDNRTTSCHKEDDKDTLKTKHDRLILCRNLRAMESFSNCKTSRNNWIRSNGIGHTSQMNQLANRAADCVDIYVDKRRNEKKSSGIKDYYHNVSDPVRYIHKKERQRKSRSKSKQKRRY
jgi:hypothetical protein